MRYEIELLTTNETTDEIERIPLVIPLTDDTGKWNDEALRWFSRKPKRTKRGR